MPSAEDPAEAQQSSILTAAEVAALLHVTPAWVYAETRRNRIPHIRLGRYVRYRREALLCWIDRLEDGAATGAQASSPSGYRAKSPRRP